MVGVRLITSTPDLIDLRASVMASMEVAIWPMALPPNATRNIAISTEGPFISRDQVYLSHLMRGSAAPEGSQPNSSTWEKISQAPNTVMMQYMTRKPPIMPPFATPTLKLREMPMASAAS